MKIITPHWKNNIAIAVNNGKLLWMKFITKICVACLLLTVCTILSFSTFLHFAHADDAPFEMDITTKTNKETGELEYHIIYLLQNEEMEKYETDDYNIDAIFLLINPDDRTMCCTIKSDSSSFVRNGIELKAVLPWDPKKSINGISLQFKNKSDSAKDSPRFNLKPVQPDSKPEKEAERPRKPSSKSSSTGETALV